MQCPICGSVDILEGIITTNYGVVFIEKGTENKFRPNAYKIEASACKSCGKIFDFRIIQKNKKQSKE